MDKATTGRIIALMAVWLLLCCTGCANLKDIRNISIRSFNVRSLSIKGLDTAAAVLEVGVDNPAGNIEVTGIEGTAYREGKVLGTFRIEPFSVEGRTSCTVEAACTLGLAPSVSPLALMSMASDFDISQYTVDINLQAKVGKGPKKKLSVKDIPLERIINELH